MKRFFTLLCTALMLIQASAYDFSVMTEGEFPMRLYYAINPDGKTVTVVEGPDTYVGAEVIIPSTITNDGKTYTVTTIGASAFEKADIDSVNMANTITDIQNGAFIGSSVRKIAFSKGLKRIGDSAFESTKYLAVVELSEGLESIGKWAFYQGAIGVNGVMNINLPSTLTYIGEQAFSYSSLTSIKWPSKIKAIPNGTFENCIYLSEVELPDNIESIGEKAFYWTAIDTIVFPSALKEIGDDAFEYTGIRHLKFPAHVKKIGKNIFCYCNSLKSVTFLDGCTEVGESMFSGCEQLTEVNLPTSLRKINYGAFGNCKHLSSIVLPEGLTEVGDYILGNSSIINVKIPSTLTDLGNGMFAGCNKLTEITIPNTVKNIGHSVFGSCTSLVKVTLPTELAKISYYAFLECRALENISIPENVDSIESAAFSNCEKLKELILPQRLKYIGTGAFSGCNRLITLSLPYTVETMGNDVFPYYESSLESVHIARSIPPYIENPSWFLTPVIRSENNITLYVPRGCKETYDNDEHWNTFKYIVEEDMDGITTYQISVEIAGGSGNIYVNDEDGKTDYEVEYNKDVVLTIEPNTGYMLKQLIVNEEDVTTNVVDNKYIIPAVSANQRVKVVFIEIPITLSIKSGNGGQVDANIEYGEKFTFNVVPEEGWKVNSVIFNGQDVTSELENGAYTTPELYRDATLNVSFESTEDAISETQVSRAKVYALDGRIVVSGTSAGDSISIYDEGGMCVENGIATGSEWIGNAKPGRVYVVKLPHKTVKIAM